LVRQAAFGRQAAIDSLKKFDPRAQIRNPVMFVVWLGALVTASLTIDPGLFGPSSASAAYNGAVTIILLLTVWFANLAEALAEGRGKAKAASLRRTLRAAQSRRRNGVDVVIALEPVPFISTQASVMSTDSICGTAGTPSPQRGEGAGRARGMPVTPFHRNLR
jgi:high-affinity K+ transport system ATPase subunit B